MDDRLDQPQLHNDSQLSTGTEDYSEISEASSLGTIAEEECLQTPINVEGLLGGRAGDTQEEGDIPKLTTMLWKSRDPGLRPFTVVRRVYLGLEGHDRLPVISQTRAKKNPLPPCHFLA